MRYKGTAIITLAIITLVASSVYAEFSVTPRPFPYEDIIYKEPKASGKTHDFKRTLTIYNQGDTLATLPGMSGSTSDLGGTTITIDPNYIAIPVNDSRRVDVIFHVPPTLEEGRHQGTVDITSSSGTVATAIPIEIIITYPTPKIVTEWEYDDTIQDFKVRAGGSYIDYIHVSEYYGYGSVSGVNLTLVREGVADISYHKELGNISAGATKIVNVNVTVPERNLIPGEYEIIPNVRASDAITKDLKKGKYVIPDPVLSINNSKIDFGKITFEVGKDTANASVEIREVEGYTPIEELSISIDTGEAGWLSYPKYDYIPPNGSVGYNFVVLLPVDASLGQKEWILEATAPFVESEKILAKVIVYPPGIDDAIEDLQNLSTADIKDINNSIALVENSIKLLDEARDKVVREVAMSMSIYSGTKTLLTKLNDASSAIGDGDLVRAGNGVIRAKSSLNKIKIGDENLEDETLKRYSSVAVTSAESLWNAIAEEVRVILENEGAQVEEMNYKSAALYYRQVSEIYSLEKETSKADQYAGKQKVLEEKYKTALDAAVNRKFAADKELEAARGKMLNILGGYIILDPLSYESVSGSYVHATSEYVAVGELYMNAGETKNKETVEEELEGIRREWRNIYLAFLAYGSVIVALFLIFIGRVSLGIQRYRGDGQSEQIGEIFVQR